MFADAGLAAVCSDARGRLIWANELFARLYCGVSAPEVIGRMFHDFVDAAKADERVEIARTTIAQSVRTHVHEIWGGIALDAVLLPLEASDEAPDGSLIAMIRREPSLSHGPLGLNAAADDAGDVRVIRTRTWNLGPLDPLSRRELEILALIGEGLSNAQIAELVHRTVKTVEFHRASISAKTGIEGRVRLAQAAQRACLYERLRGAGYRVPDIRDLDRDPDLQTVGSEK